MQRKEKAERERENNDFVHRVCCSAELLSPSQQASVKLFKKATENLESKDAKVAHQTNKKMTNIVKLEEVCTGIISCRPVVFK